MNEIRLCGLRFGSGRPKICVPLTGKTLPELTAEAGKVKTLPADLYEWRIDHFSGDLESAMAVLKEELSEKPLLCTVRTKGQGGELALAPEKYEKLLLKLLNMVGPGLLDIELSTGEERVRKLVTAAKTKGVGVVISHHDFSKTPPRWEMEETLERMKALGADLPKLAVMPQSPEDVLELLSATLHVSERLGPVITMAMGELGKISRICGSVFGSCMTFGAGSNASAPGQLDARDLLTILEKLTSRK